jgi:hypothetical protein
MEQFCRNYRRADEIELVPSFATSRGSESATAEPSKSAFSTPSKPRIAPAMFPTAGRHVPRFRSCAPPPLPLGFLERLVVCQLPHQASHLGAKKRSSNSPSVVLVSPTGIVQDRGQKHRLVSHVALGSKDGRDCDGMIDVRRLPPRPCDAAANAFGRRMPVPQVIGWGSKSVAPLHVVLARRLPSISVRGRDLTLICRRRPLAAVMARSHPGEFCVAGEPGRCDHQSWRQRTPPSGVTSSSDCSTRKRPPY